MRLARYSLILVCVCLVSLSSTGCSLKSITGPRTNAIGVAINDSQELLTVTVSTEPNVKYTVSAGHQVDHAFNLDVSVPVNVSWNYPDGRQFRYYTFSPNDVFGEYLDKYGVKCDFIIRASGANNR